VNAEVLGRSIRRLDGEAKVRGAAIYGIDYEESGMLHARILRSPVAAGRIVRLDLEGARSMAEVRAIVTAADAPRRFGLVVRDTTLMADKLVRYAGEPIAAVAADSYGAAAAAVAAIELEIEPLPAVTEIEQSLGPEAALVHPDWNSYEVTEVGVRQGNLAWEARLETGDVAGGFARADRIIEDHFLVPRQHQCSIEPRVCVARYEHPRFVIHTSTQFPHAVRRTTAEVLGVPESDVEVVPTVVGGGFGGKLDATLEPVAALLSRKAGRPVKIANTRSEEFRTGSPRQNAIIRIRSAVTNDGRILAREATCLMDNGAYAGEQPIGASFPLIFLAGTYRVESARVLSRNVYTNTAPTGSFRGIQGTFCTFALERHMDHIAEELGMDRRELRLRNVYRDGDTTPTGQALSDPAFVDAFARIEEIAPWSAVTARRPWQGVGLACAMGVTAGGPSSAALKLDEDGRIVVVPSGTEIGTGAIFVGVAKVVAAELGVRPEDVVVTGSNTAVGAYDMGAQGSRTTFSAGNAAREAAGLVREKILGHASEMLEVAPADLELVDGEVRVVGAPLVRRSLADVARFAHLARGPVAATGNTATPPIPTDPARTSGAIITAFNAPTYHVHLAQVEVDPETGKVTILRYIVAQDVGRVVDRRAIRGQIQGGVVQGVGYALFEELRLERGLYVDDTFETYRLPTALDAPAVEMILLEHPAPHGPLGAKGVAEPPIIPVAAAIANAVADAIGRPVNRLPITPFAVLEALGERPEPSGARHG
jgi:CO/xanthine dehydrogenase Mo-binding subunit